MDAHFQEPEMPTPGQPIQGAHLPAEDAELQMERAAEENGEIAAVTPDEPSDDPA